MNPRRTDGAILKCGDFSPLPIAVRTNKIIDDRGVAITGKVSRNGTLNLAGSVGLIVNIAFYRAYPSTFVNLVWLVIATVALLKIVRTLDQPTTST